MKLKPETAAALETLYGGAAPACATAQDTVLLWQNGDEAADLLTALRPALNGTPGADRPLIPADGLVHFTYGEEAWLCRVQRLMQDGECYFVMVFERLKAARRVTVPEMRQLLAEHDAACDAVVARLLMALTPADADVPDEAGIRAACTDILCLSRRDAQLLWYESATEDLLAVLEPIEVSKYAVRIAEVIGRLCGGMLRVHTEIAPEPGFARADAAQLCAALLSLFVTAQRGDPQCSDVTFLYRRTPQQLMLGLRTEQGAPAPHAAEKLKPYAPDGTLISEEVLLTRFCRTFGAALRHTQTDAGMQHTLVLPALPGDAIPQAFHDPAYNMEPIPGGLLSYSRIMLSRILR